MTGTTLTVKISENDKCVYENNSNIEPSENNLSSLILSLKQTQIKINDFLTSIIEEQDSLANSELLDLPRSESESDFDEEIEVNPKKCKLIN
nr:uncharacterized protein LOC116427434 [Nomia melanderi]